MLNWHVLLSAEMKETQEDTGKSMKNILYVLQCAKRYISGWSDVNQAHTTVLAIFKLGLFEGGSQSLEN